MEKMDIPPPIKQDQIKTNWCARTATTIYLLLLPFLFMFAVASILIFDSPSMTVPIGLSIIFMYFCVPLSIPFTLYLVWSRYSQNHYKKSRQFCLIPLCVAVAAVAYDALISSFRLL